MHRNFLTIGAIFGGLAVLLGAFGAHKLKEMVPAETVSSFQTGVQYQMYHALALLAIGILAGRNPSRWLKWSGNCFIAGILLFSGSLYLLTALKASDQVGLRGLGLITPIGGVVLVLGWGLMVVGAGRSGRRLVN